MLRKAAFLLAICGGAVAAQTPRVVLLEVETENSVVYRFDVFDASKLALNPGPTTPIPDTAFREGLTVDDVLTVNGKSARGLHFLRGTNMYFNPAPQPGSAIADVNQGGSGTCSWELYSKEGRFVGRLVDGGFFPHAVLGGAGAFFGARGEHFFTSARPQRLASVMEDPSRRRALGGGAYRVTFLLVLLFYPEVEVTAGGPSIFHSDFSLVTPENPAHPNEVLTLRARNLGPTTPDSSRGQSFPLLTSGISPAVVNADVEITVNGETADAINKVGWPGESGVYRVDFRVPGGATAGTATLRLTAAWITSDAVTFPVR